MLALLALSCGARTDLDVPPPAPPPECTLDDTIPTIPPCAALELGEPVNLSESLRPGGAHVGQHAASPHRGGAAVAYQISLLRRDAPATDVELRVLALDAEARAQDGPQVILAEHVPAMGMGSFVYSAGVPSVSGGCEVHALGSLRIREISETARLAIAGDSGLELVEVEGWVWDLRRDGEVISWLGFPGSSLELVFADREGRILRRAPLEPSGGDLAFPDVSRHALEDGTFVLPMELEGSTGPFTELAHHDESGAHLGNHPLTPATVGHTALAWREGERWLFWSERDRRDGARAPRSLHAAPLADDGTLGPALAFELDGLDGMGRFTPAWIGGWWIIPTVDRETDTSHLGVFDEEGDQHARLPLGGGVPHTAILPHTAHVVLTPAGAIVTYDEARVGDAGSIPDFLLRARTVRCIAP